MTRTNNTPNTITLSVSLGESDQLTSLVHSLVEKELASVLSRLVGGLEPPTNKAAVSEPAPVVSKVSAPVPENVEAAPKPKTKPKAASKTTAKRELAPAVPVLDCVGAVPRPYVPVSDNWDDIIHRYQSGEINQRDAAKEAGVSVATLKKYAGESRVHPGSGAYRKRVRPGNWYRTIDRFNRGELSATQAASEVGMNLRMFYRYRTGENQFANA